ncbi:MAG TPA: GNAT family N-acetyltransferase [Roseiarcus sp.]|nr:GNAT family N-acetyltransferase [Roseiarcus sp.]
MSSLLLRPATAADLDAIMAIERAPGYERRVGRSTLGEHQALLAGPRHAYFVGAREGVEAFAILRDLDDINGNVYLKRIAARPGRSAGRALLRLLLDWTFAHTQAHRFHLDCFDDNAPAQAMYARLGFSRDGVLREAYLDADGRRRDLVLMALTRPQWAAQPRRSSTISAP